VIRSADAGYRDAEAAYDTIIYVTRDLPELDTLTEACGWPEGVLPRQEDKGGFDKEQQAAFDLTMIATAYMLLHEMRHVMFNIDDVNQPQRDEEMLCDEFARNFLLDGIDSYVQSSGELVPKVLMKRAAGITLGACIVYEFTPAQARPGELGHPPIADRLVALMEAIPDRVDNQFWVFAASLLVALLKRQNRAAPIPTGEGRALCGVLIEALRREA
jgi:Peptidase U49